MAIKRRRRGISLGTLCMLSLCVIAGLTGMAVFSRISGDTGAIAFDPKLIAEPLMALARGVTDAVTEPAAPKRQPLRGEALAQLPTMVLLCVTPQPTAVQPSPTPEPALQPSRGLTITAVGQVGIGTELRANAFMDGRAYAFYDMVSPIAHELTGADLSIVTMRTCLSDNAGAFDIYNAPSSLVDGLKATGLNLFNFATDRICDHGVSGILETRAAMEEKKVSFAGIYRAQEERTRPVVVDIGGVKVGLLAYTGSVSTAGKSAVSAQDIAMYTRHLTSREAAAEISALRAGGADVVIALPFWGSRSDTKPSKEMRAEADALIAAGADVILGAGPTSVHEIERRTVTDAYGDKREVFIAYSLGNFLIDDSRDTANITGMIVTLSLTWDAQARLLHIGDAWYMPTWIMRWRDASGINRYRVVPAGVSAIPEGMTESIYINMKKAYQGLVSRLGSEAARPRAE